MKKRILLASILAVSSITANASDISYDEIKLGYGSMTIDGFSGSISGVGVSGKVSISDYAYLSASYAGVSGNVEWLNTTIKAESSGSSFGLGGHFSVQNNVDLLAGIKMSSVTATASSGNITATATETEASIFGGFRAMVTPKVELSGLLSNSSSGTVTSGGVTYYINKQFGIGVDYASSQSSQITTASVSVLF